MNFTKIDAEIWIHPHFKTGEIIQVEPLSWYGPIFLLDAFNDEDIGDLRELLEPLPLDEEISVTITFDYEDKQPYAVKIETREPKKP